MDIPRILPRLREAPVPGGKLVALDLYKQRSFPEYVSKTLATPADLFMKYRTRGGHSVEPGKVAWRAHGERDVL